MRYKNNEQREEQAALYANQQEPFLAGMLPAHTGLFSHFPSLDHPSVSLYRNISEVEAFGRG